MQLTELQIRVVEEIATGKIFDIYSFVSSIPVKVWGSEKPKMTFTIADDYQVTADTPVNKVMNEEEALNQFKQFVALWDFLEKLGMIKSVQLRQVSPRILYFVKKDDEPFFKLMFLIYPYIHKEIVPLPPLKDFVQRGFLTEEEFFYQQEDKDRKGALRLTRRVAYISLATSIFVAVAAAIFNYLTYTTERAVIVKNPNAFSDTTKVLVLEPRPNVLKDSTGDTTANRVRGKVPNAKSAGKKQ